jgi:outer membrane protein
VNVSHLLFNVLPKIFNGSGLTPTWLGTLYRRRRNNLPIIVSMKPHRGAVLTPRLHSNAAVAQPCQRADTAKRYGSGQAVLRKGYCWLAVVLISSSNNIYATEAWERLATPLADPLLTLPPAIQAQNSSMLNVPALPCPVSYLETAPLSLAHAVDLALCNNPQIQSAWAAIKIQAAAVGEARAAYLPTLSTNVSRMHDRVTQGKFNKSEHSSTVYGSLSWRLFDFGGRGANRRSANALLSAALASHQATLQKTLANVVSAYFDAQATLVVWRTKTENEAALQKIWVAAQRRQMQGVGAQTDTLQASTALARMTLEKNRALAAYQKALAVLVQTVGLPAQTQFTLSDEMTQRHTDSFAKAGGEDSQIGHTADLPIHQRTKHHNAAHQATATLMLAGANASTAELKQNGQDHSATGIKGDWHQRERQDLDQWLIEIQQQHPALLAARQQVQSAQERVWTTTSEGLPIVDFSASYYKNGRPNQSLTPNVNETLYGVTLTIPLFDGFARTYKVRGAQASLAQKQAELFDIEQQVLLDVIKTHAEASTSLDNLSAAQQYLQYAQQTLDSVQRKFTRGAADMPAILNAQMELANAQQEHIRCLTDWRSAKLRLFASAGMLERADIK